MRSGVPTTVVSVATGASWEEIESSEIDENAAILQWDRERGWLLKLAFPDEDHTNTQVIGGAETDAAGAEAQALAHLHWLREKPPTGHPLADRVRDVTLAHIAARAAMFEAADGQRDAIGDWVRSGGTWGEVAGVLNRVLGADTWTAAKAKREFRYYALPPHDS